MTHVPQLVQYRARTDVTPCLLYIMSHQTCLMCCSSMYTDTSDQTTHGIRSLVSPGTVRTSTVLSSVLSSLSGLKMTGHAPQPACLRLLGGCPYTYAGLPGVGTTWQAAALRRLPVALEGSLVQPETLLHPPRSAACKSAALTDDPWIGSQTPARPGPRAQRG